MPTLGERIKAAREAAGLTQGELGDLLGGVDYTRVSKWETDAQTPKHDKLVLLTESLGICGHWLLTGQGPMKPGDIPREVAAFREVAAIVDDARKPDDEPDPPPPDQPNPDGGPSLRA